MPFSSLLALVVPLVLALPAPAPQPLPMPVPLPVPQGSVTNPFLGLLGSLIEGSLTLSSFETAVPAILADLADVASAGNAVTQAIANGTIAGTDVPAVVQKLFQVVKPTTSPTSIPDAMSLAAQAFGVNTPYGHTPSQSPAPEQDILSNVLTLILNGFTSPDIIAVAAGADPFTNSYLNTNPPVPFLKTFYNTIQGNAPLDVPEPQLRAAMYIPPSFTWGKKQPVLMSPGTGTTGSINFQSNIGKLLSQESFADPVYLNIPNQLLSDAQVSAEYVSYALQYLYALTGQKPAIVTWSQGSLDAQWAFKYWPSTREIVTDMINISPDYHGTILAYLLCPGFATGNSIACTPSVAQQDYNSNFVTQLRKNGGDSAYVPTTTIYSLLDEIVEPQDGTAASGFINDARGIGVSNTFLQGACFAQPAGTIFTHEGVLYNSVAYALVVDALKNPGPGSFARVEGQCADAVAAGISLSDVIETESLIPLAVLGIFSYLPKALSEPALKAYATY